MDIVKQLEIDGPPKSNPPPISTNSLPQNEKRSNSKSSKTLV